MKYYGVRFGTGDPRSFTGLTPTFLYFVNMATNATITPPAISEMFATTGIYTFAWGTTTPIAFLIDAATTTPGANGRYVTGQLDPSDRNDEYSATMIAIGTSQIAQGTSLLAYSASLTAQGTTIYAQNIAMGSTLTGFGNTSIALGTTILYVGLNTFAVGSTTFSWVTNTYNYALATYNDVISLGVTVTNFADLSLAQGATNYQAIVNEGVTLVNVGNKVDALGNSLSTGLTLTVAGIGSTASSYGNSTSDPVDLFGYLKRIQELLEGANTYNKVSGAFSLYSRGSSALLRALTVANSVSLVTKS